MDEQQSKCSIDSNTGTQAIIPIWGTRKEKDNNLQDYFPNIFSDTGSHLGI